jgi:hypothetical protein
MNSGLTDMWAPRRTFRPPLLCSRHVPFPPFSSDGDAWRVVPAVENRKTNYLFKPRKLPCGFSSVFF